ncbi:MAG: T9SS type A sorting domain-containing protein [Bacteroidota bacterium]
MKRTTLLIVLLILAVLSMSMAPYDRHNKGNDPYRIAKVATKGDYVKFDVNNISTFVRNNGSFNRDPGTGAAGFEWPKGSGNTAIYASGLWMGALVNGSARVAIAEYSYEFDAGPIAAGVDPGADRYHVYKIKRGDDAKSNPDWANWPWQDGAPVLKKVDGTDSLDADGNRIPALIGDMMVWCVYNDNNPKVHTNQLTEPLGIEVQMTAFAYNRSDALGNTIYCKWKVINKGGNKLDDTYITIWADCDIGDGANDYDGCDTTLGIGYTYCDNPSAAGYQIAPAAGFDFLQGPLVNGTAQDTAKFPDGRIFPGKKFLKMTRYVKYSNDRSNMGNPDIGAESYNYMKGLARDGTPIVDDLGNPAKFMYPGDPTQAYDAATNWIENTDVPGDRRFMMTAGPFNMAVGDTQEIVAANLIAQGTTNFGSVSSLKVTDAAAQLAYDLNFTLSPPPLAPTVSVGQLNDEIVLSWGEDDSATTAIENTVTPDPIAAAAGATFDTYMFEGYVVYQLANISGDDPKMLKTYDLKVNPHDPALASPAIIYDDVFDKTVGNIVNKPVKFGENKGIQRSIRIKTDVYTGDPLANGKDYYFAVTSYTYNKESVPKTLESAIKTIRVRPTQLPGVRLHATNGDTLRTVAKHVAGASDVVHTAGISEATIIPFVVNPALLKGHIYSVLADYENGARVGWKLRDETVAQDLLTSPNLGPSQGGNSYSWPIKDGIEWVVLDVKSRPNPDSCSVQGDVSWLESTGWFDPSTGGGVLDPTESGYVIMITGSDMPTYLGHMSTAWDMLNNTPIEVRFGPGQSQNAYRMRRAGGVSTSYVIQETNPFVPVPFTVWDMTNPASPRQLTVSWRDQDNDATFNPTVDNYLEFAIIYNRTYNAAGGQWLYQNAAGHVAADWSDVATAKSGADIMYAMSIALVDGQTTGNAVSKFIVIPYKPIKAADVYTVTISTAPTQNDSLARIDLDKIMAVPNPYFGASAYERDQFNHVVRFTNLPQTAKIRIFNLAGQLVRVIDKNDTRTTADWDLLNNSALPIASGMYIAYIDMPGIGTKILKMAVIMSEERLDNY